ncbi:MAG: type III pantothenate kinase [Pirellulales bacterium]
MAADTHSLIAVDIGNSQIKFGWYLSAVADTFIEPIRTVDLAGQPFDPNRLATWLVPPSAETVRTSYPTEWLVASVNRPAMEGLFAWAHDFDARIRIRELVADDLTLEVAVPAVHRIGIDRLAAAVAVNRLRDAARPAIVIDLGTAITVDVVSSHGAFAGGAILPGIGMSARALAEQTDQLPELPLDRLEDPPAPVGTSTEAAIRSGLFWGAIGAMRELITRMEAELPTKPQLYVTGGAAPAVVELLGSEARYVPHLVLGGIAVAHAAWAAGR